VSSPSPRLALLALLAPLALAGCSKPQENPAAVLAVVKQRLLEREARLGSYRFSGTVQDAGAEPIEFSFAHRAPQRMRGALLKPVSRVFAWDGTQLYVQDDAQKRLTTFKDDLPPEKRAGFLTETFSPFTPEGFRVPLLLSTTRARRATHPRAPEAVELSVQVQDGSSGGLEMTYVLRWPALDFLGKRTRAADGTTAEVRVEEEHCDEALKLCVPKRLTRWSGEQQVGSIQLAQVELNPSLPNDSFTLTAPEGYDVQSRTLVEVTAK
jgi:outer membrane lipoprotein-sorting protein